MRLTKSIFIIILLFYSFNPISMGYAQSPLWNPNYNKVQKLIFDNSASAEDLVNFTVLVHLNSSIIDWDDFQTDGDDIRFIDEDYETYLDYEIETWNHGYDAWIWVRIPQIDSNSAIDHIYMYYDNPLAVNGEDKEGAWNSDCVMVQHMVDETNASILDSTQYDNDGTKKGADEPIETIDGQINSAQNYDDNDYILVNDDSSLDFGVSIDFTVSAWINTSISDVQYIISRKPTDNVGFRFIVLSSKIYIGIDDGVNQRSTRSDILVDDGVFHYVVAVCDRDGNMQVFIDGVPDGTPVAVGAVGDITTNEDMYIGSKVLMSLAFNGILDEVRISNVTRSNDWVKAQYLSTIEEYITHKELSLCDSFTDSGILIGIFILVPIIAIIIGVNRRR